MRLDSVYYAIWTMISTVGTNLMDSIRFTKLLISVYRKILLFHRELQYRFNVNIEKKSRYLIRMILCSKWNVVHNNLHKQSDVIDERK